MNLKIFGYICVIAIGVGFIIMAASNTFHSAAASISQAIAGAIFIIAAIIKIVSESKEERVK